MLSSHVFVYFVTVFLGLLALHSCSYPTIILWFFGCAIYIYCLVAVIGLVLSLIISFCGIESLVASFVFWCKSGVFKKINNPNAFLRKEWNYYERFLNGRELDAYFLEIYLKCMADLVLAWHMYFIHTYVLFIVINFFITNIRRINPSNVFTELNSKYQFAFDRFCEDYCFLITADDTYTRLFFRQAVKILAISQRRLKEGQTLDRELDREIFNRAFFLNYCNDVFFLSLFLFYFLLFGALIQFAFFLELF